MVQGADRTSGTAVEIRVKGIVQGVGFRPFVYRLAKDLGLGGSIINTPSGVLIKVTGGRRDIAVFMERIEREAPPLASIQSLESRDVPVEGHAGVFQIRASSGRGEPRTLVPPDVATCRDCAAEIMDRDDRRFGYAFTNCTNCGPRFTIIEALPYDRENTSMKSFEMCERCLSEYRNPADRRFHAQPNACPRCGPALSWKDASGSRVDQPLERAADFLSEGKIVAVKGIGGFHIAASAFSVEAVARLRAGKMRPFKPFAVMARSLEAAEKFCRVPADARRLLISPCAPVVLAARREPCGLAENIAPGLCELGVMLPYTPLHYLLFAAGSCPECLIMTSGNPRGEPLCTDNQEALDRLGGIVDGFLLHDRQIYTGVDDSVVRIMAGRSRFIRRSRGFAPAPLELKVHAGRGLAVGAELKNTFCLTLGKEAFLSQHMGNLTSPASFRFFRENISHLEKLLNIRPEFVACDLHPDYLSTRFAEETGLPVFHVQHHFAHAASVMAEHGIDQKVLALVLDGTGYGPDKTIWGGEILECSTTGFRRLGRISPFPLPGADAASGQPWRLALSLLFCMGLSDRDIPRKLKEQVPREKRRVILEMMEAGINSPPASSCGRLFDAVSALCGLCLENSYEGQGAMMLETCCRQALEGRSILDTEEFHSFLPGEGLWKTGNHIFREVQWDVCAGKVLEYIREDRNVRDTALLFHAFLIAAFGSCLLDLKKETGISRVVLGGGCMQNRILLEGFLEFLGENGLSVYANEKVPANDGGICLGQALAGAGLYEVSKCA